MTMKKRRLTMRNLSAIQEALLARLAGELDGSDGDLPRKDYEQALAWAEQQIDLQPMRRDIRTTLEKGA